MNQIEDVLGFWFPANAGEDFETHKEYWMWRMRGGAHGDIIDRFSDLTAEAAGGACDHWADTPRGRLALIVVLDQFSRSVWAGTGRAFAQDRKALALALEGMANGDFDKLETVWEKAFFQMPLGHCEGPDLLNRLNRAVAIADTLLEEAPAHLKPLYEFSAQQPREARKVVQAFGRHPHRNDVLGRESTVHEAAYLEQGKFPHQRDLEQGEIVIPDAPDSMPG